MELVSFSIVFILAVLALFLFGLFLIAKTVYQLTFKRKQLISTRKPLMILAVGILLVVAVILMEYSAHKNTGSYDKYARMSNSYFSPGKLPEGYQVIASNNDRSIDLKSATLYQLHPVDYYKYYAPPKLCAIKLTLHQYGAQAGNEPCRLLVTTPAGYAIYQDVKNPEYVGTIRSNTLLVLYRQDIAQHISEISEIIDNLVSLQ